MAIVHFVKSKRTQTVGGLNGVLNYCCKASKVDYEGRPLVSGINCVPQCALQEFMNTKRLHHSTKGRLYYHMVQSFRPDDPVTPEMAHEIALKLAEQIPGFEIVVATHTDRDHIHSHFVINSVSCDTGLKYHSNRDSLEQLWKASDELCMQYGLSVVKPKKKQKKERTMSDREYRAYAKGDSWKMNLEIIIDECMTLARDREHFIRLMEYSGYEVRWEDTRKNITYGHQIAIDLPTNIKNEIDPTVHNRQAPLLILHRNQGGKNTNRNNQQSSQKFQHTCSPLQASRQSVILQSNPPDTRRKRLTYLSNTCARCKILMAGRSISSGIDKACAEAIKGTPQFAAPKVARASSILPISSQTITCAPKVRTAISMPMSRG